MELTRIQDAIQARIPHYRRGRVRPRVRRHQIRGNGFYGKLMASSLPALGIEEYHIVFGGARRLPQRFHHLDIPITDGSMAAYMRPTSWNLAVIISLSNGFMM